MENRYGNVNIADNELIKGCLKKDRRYQELLYRKYARKMFYVCLSFTGDQDEAADILQESFLKVFRTIEKFQYRGSFEGYIRRIVRNTAIDYYRNNSRLGFYVPIEEAYELSSDDNEQFEKRLGASEVFDHLRKLPDGARMVFHLFAVEGFSHKEIAQKLEISESTSKSQYHRARSLLMDMINKNETN